LDISLNTQDIIDLENHISRSLLNHLYEGIYFVDKNREIKFWNKGAEVITGYKSDEVIGKKCFDNLLSHEDNYGRNLCGMCCPLIEAIEKEEYVNERIYLYNKQGKKIPVWVHVSPIKNKMGEIIGAVEVFVDDSAYENLKIANNRLEELNDIKNQFLGMAAHDLRNPLTVIYSYSKLMTDFNSENLNEQQVSMLNRINKSCKQLLVLINDLLDITSIDSGKVNIEKKKVKISDILNPDNYSFQWLACYKDINVDIITEVPDFEVEVDINRIIQVIENLLSNAIKYSYSDTTVTLTAKIENNAFILSVKDEGQGIPEEDISKLFKPFEKASVKPTGKETSTGLGLVIVKKIVDLHNGTINVKSEVNKGSEFIVSLPL
jgi:PAS domain S-box-containing protein